MTTIRVDKRHKDIYVKALTEAQIKVDVYTMENIDACRLFIHSDEPDVLLLIGVMIGHNIADESVKTVIG